MFNGESSYRRFLNGDESAFEEIMREYRDSLTFFINRYVNDYDAAEDIAIDVFMYIIVHPNRYNFKVSLKTYLFMLGRSRALDYLRKRKRRSEAFLSEHTKEVSYDFESLIEKDEKRRILYSAIDSLADDMRVAIHLVYFEELTYKEAAVIMKKSVKQVDNLIYRGKKELSAVLGKEGELLL
ncbi:MAG: RNA polymerase sigma factor [Clostridia bacterium]|nr:RNA polymerase sigma factor [Clostridia bacterium]